MVWAMLDRGTTVAGKMDGQDLPCQFLEIEKDGPKFVRSMVVFIYA